MRSLDRAAACVYWSKCCGSVYPTACRRPGHRFSGTQPWSGVPRRPAGVPYRDRHRSQHSVARQAVPCRSPSIMDAAAPDHCGAPLRWTLGVPVGTVPSMTKNLNPSALRSFCSKNCCSIAPLCTPLRLNALQAAGIPPRRSARVKEGVPHSCNVIYDIES